MRDEKADDGEGINVQESIYLGTGMRLDRVGKFGYLVDMLNGGVSYALCVESWEEVSLKLKGKAYVTCVRSVMVCGSQTRDEDAAMDV